jgi:hypothetical protein
MRTLLLDQGAWDLVLNASGNIAVADAPYAVAQDVASAIRVQLGELWYDTAQGVPYLPEILGTAPNLPFIKAQIERAALTVPTVAQARCVFATFANRVLTGQVQVIDDTGTASNVSF